ncbi:M23 family metallopeptidase [Campylobacter concisus]|uniref:M23 family metallopeptidase n=1 Tax=Campylobacter concisus TaxID=199 RepID=UPI001F1A49D9|nr:M23 family metallopeptidase [Campylobacter concisus]
MPLTPRNDVNFKRNLIDIIKFSYDNDISRPFISNNKLLIGYGFSLKDDIELICTQIYKNNKDKVIKDIKRTITNTTSTTTIEKIDTDELFKKINDAAKGAYAKSGGADTLPEFEFSSEDQLNAILEQKLTPLIQEINQKLNNSPLKNLQAVSLTSDTQNSQISREHIALLALLYISKKSNIDPSLASYIKSKNRFKAWFWLAYESFSDEASNKTSILREKISNQFGLYESDEQNVNFAECIDVFSHLNISKVKYKSKNQNNKEIIQDVTHLEFMKLQENGSKLNASDVSKCGALFQPFVTKINSLLSTQSTKTFSLENIYCINLISSNASNTSRINKLLRQREEEFYKQENILLLCPRKMTTPIRVFQPKKSEFTVVLASQTPFDCSELNPKELNSSRPNYGKVNLCELILTDFKFDSYEDSKNEEIKFKNAKSKDTVILYQENKNEEDKINSATFTSIKQNSDDIEYKLEDGVISMKYFEDQTSNNKHLNFSLLNFAKENNFTLRDDKDSAMFDIKLRLAHGNNVVPTSASSSGLTLTINNLIIENEDGKASEDIDKIYLHHCFDKSIYESISLVKNEDSDIKNSYTATFNIPIDKENKGDTKFILYSSDLSKVYSTKDIHAHSDTAVISLGYQDKSSSNFCYSNKVSLRDITDHITNVISDSEYPFKTNEPICLKAIYKQEKGSKRYKEILWGYKVIKSKEYDELSKLSPKDVVVLKDQKGKEITFKISDVIQKDDLDKLKQGGHTIVFFAYLEGDKDKFKFYTRYGKNHIRIDIKIPLYIKFKDDKLVIYEFEHATKEKAFDAKLKLSDDKDDALIKNDNYLYINKNISSNEINIYEDDKLSKELKSDEKTNKSYQIYAKEESSSNQSNADKDDKLGINLLSKENMDKFINSFNESKSLTRVNKGMWEDGDEEVLVKVEMSNEIVFPLKIKPLNNRGMEYDWTLMLGDKGESQAIFGRNRNNGKRQHAARDLYTDMPFKKNVDIKTFKSDVEIVSIADGEVIKTGNFYCKTDHITIQYDTVEFGSFIIRYGEVDPSRVKVKAGDMVRKGQVIGYSGLMIDNGDHPNIVDKKIVTMLHFEYFTNGANKDDPLTVTNDPNNKFKRRKDLADPIEILKEGYKNTFGEIL